MITGINQDSQYIIVSHYNTFENSLVVSSFIILEAKTTINRYQAFSLLGPCKYPTINKLYNTVGKKGAKTFETYRKKL